MGKILGIDLGTTNSAMAVMTGSDPTIIENDEGARTTPSVVAMSKTGERLVGLLAKRQAVTNPENTISGIKRFVGHSYEEDIIKEDKKIVPFKINSGEGGGVTVTMGDKDYRPEEISAMILQKLKKDAEAKLGETISEVIITVPAYFNDAQRKATKDAGKIAGLEVKRIINEPTAAALAYGFDKKKNEQIAVYDFGGGTFDVSILEVGDNVIEVKSTDGDSHMGGRDIDQKIIRWISEEFKKESGIDVSKDPLALQRLDEAAEKAKLELSTTTETEINIPFITSDSSGPRHLLLKLNRAKLEELASEFVEKSMTITKRALEASGFKKEDIDEIVLVGGQTRMPAIQEAVKNFFGKEANRSINPDEVVAMGAAIQAGILQGDVKDVLLLDVIPLSLGIETMGGVSTKLIERNTTLPTSKTQVFSTAADSQTSVEVHVLQGERAMASDNKSLGRFILDGIPPAPRGVPQVEVSFDIDADGILNATAKDKVTNKTQSIRIEASSELKEEDIEKMRKDAEAHSDEDLKRRELAETRNLSDQAIYTAEKAIKDNSDKISEEVKKEVEEKIKEVKEIKEKDDVSVLKEKTEQLSTVMQKIGEDIAKNTSETSDQKQTDNTSQQKTEEKIHDVETEEEKDKDENKDDDNKSNT